MKNIQSAEKTGLFRPRLIGLGLVALSLALLAGCAVGPDYHKPVTKVPSAWDGQNVQTKAQPSKATNQPVKLVEWWKSFKDPTLTALVEIAIHNNLDVRTAEARIREARAALGVAGAPLWPGLNSSAIYQRSQSSSATVTSGGTAISTAGGLRELFQVGLDSSWELDIFGGTRRNIEAAGADLQAAMEDRRDVLVTMVGEVGNNYLNLRGYQQQIAIAQKNLTAQKHNAEITRKRFEAGYVGALDVANANAQVATTAAQIPTLEASARAAIYSLGVLLGKEPAALEKDLAKAGPIPPQPIKIPVGLPSELLQRRPDIRRAEAQLHAATARIGVATADLFPKFSLTGSFGFSSNDLTKLGNLASSKFWSVGPTITWPIFAGGQIMYNIKVQDALTEQALLTYRKAILTAMQEVNTALVNYAKEQDRRKALAVAVVNNRKAVDLAMKLYVAGKTDFLNVLTAQLNLYNTENSLVQSTSTVDTDLIALYKAMGGGWQKNALPPDYQDRAYLDHLKRLSGKSNAKVMPD
jgi:multidrug efflux system outer membrane protein